MKKLFFLTLACGGAMLLNGAELKLQSAADGMLIDRNGDGVVESVLTHTQEKPVLELLTGKLGNGIHRSVLEYKLPEKSAVAKATLTVTLNGRTWVPPGYSRHRRARKPCCGSIGARKPTARSVWPMTARERKPG